jgi:hypothetical protein
MNSSAEKLNAAMFVLRILAKTRTMIRNAQLATVLVLTTEASSPGRRRQNFLQTIFYGV